jgi:hypothetical protein
MATGQAEIYTAKMGQPPMPDEGPTMPTPSMARKRKRAMNPNMPPGQTDIYTADKGQPPMDYEGPTANIKPKKYVMGGSVGKASSRADGCAQRGKTKGRMV